MSEKQNELQRSRHTLEGRLEALRALQEASREGDGAEEWLQAQDLGDAERLLSAIQVEHGWELAVETVLGEWLDFVLATDPRRPAAAMKDLESVSLGILQDGRGRVRPRSGSMYQMLTVG